MKNPYLGLHIYNITKVPLIGLVLAVPIIQHGTVVTNLICIWQSPSSNPGSWPRILTGLSYVHLGLLHPSTSLVIQRRIPSNNIFLNAIESKDTRIVVRGKQLASIECVANCWSCRNPLDCQFPLPVRSMTDFTWWRQRSRWRKTQTQSVVLKLGWETR